jgi:hypothetical protein
MTSGRYIRTKETKIKMSLVKKGKHYSPKTEFKKGNKINLGRKKIEQSGDKNKNWKGNKVGYRGLHYWIIRNKPKSMFCEKCGKVTNKLDASSINHTYKRDISEWRWLCRKCHKREDV